MEKDARRISALSVPSFEPAGGDEYLEAPKIMRLFGSVILGKNNGADQERPVLFLGLTSDNHLMATFYPSEIDLDQLEKHRGDLSKRGRTEHDLDEMGLTLIIPYRIERDSLRLTRTQAIGEETGFEDRMNFLVIPPVQAGEKRYETKPYPKSILLSDFLAQFRPDHQTALLEFIPAGSDEETQRSVFCFLIRNPESGHSDEALALFPIERANEKEMAGGLDLTDNRAVANSLLHDLISSVSRLHPNDFEDPLSALRKSNSYRQLGHNLSIPSFLQHLLELQTVALVYEKIINKTGLMRRFTQLLQIRSGRLVNRKSAARLVRSTSLAASEKQKGLLSKREASKAIEGNSVSLSIEPDSVSQAFRETDKIIAERKSIKAGELAAYKDGILKVVENTQGANIDIYRAGLRRMEIAKIKRKGVNIFERGRVSREIFEAELGIRIKAVEMIGFPEFLRSGGDIVLIREFFGDFDLRKTSLYQDFFGKWQGREPKGVWMLAQKYISPVVALGNEIRGAYLGSAPSLEQYTGPNSDYYYNFLMTSEEWKLAGRLVLGLSRIQAIGGTIQGWKDTVGDRLDLRKISGARHMTEIESFFRRISKTVTEIPKSPDIYGDIILILAKIADVDNRVLQSNIYLPVPDDSSSTYERTGYQFAQIYLRNIYTDYFLSCALPHAKVGDFFLLDRVLDDPFNWNLGFMDYCLNQLYNMAVVEHNPLLRNEAVKRFREASERAEKYLPADPNFMYINPSFQTPRIPDFQKQMADYLKVLEKK